MVENLDLMMAEYWDDGKVAQLVWQLAGCWVCYLVENLDLMMAECWDDGTAAQLVWQ